MSRLKIASVFLAFLVTTSANAELFFGAPPRENDASAHSTYGPLANKLSELVGEKVTYLPAANWPEYSDNMRNGKYDIIFDGPHFVGWRIKHINHKAVARLPGDLKFLIVSKADNARVNSLRDLRSRKVCSTPSPNLLAVSWISLFNGIVLPQAVEVQGDAPNIYKAFVEQGRCDAAVLRDVFIEKRLSPEQKQQLKELKVTSFPNQAVTVSTRVKPEQVTALRSFLTGDSPALMPILERFAGKEATSMIAADGKDYVQHAALLEGVVWGW